MGIQHPTNNSPDLLRMRAAFMGRHKLRDYKLSGRHLMKMVLTSGADKAAVDRVRDRFTYSYGCFLKWSGPAFDHLEMMGRDGRALVLISHPYSIDDEGRRDLALLQAGGLRVVIEGKERSWYGYGTEHIRIEHPAFSGQVVRQPDIPLPPTRPASPSARIVAETAFEARLRRAGPALLALARERAAELAAALAMIPCVGPRSEAPCVACAMRTDLMRINALISGVEDVDDDRPSIFAGVTFDD
jgi:hypothetical protein